jgi:DivIVA domain-containing protein
VISFEGIHEVSFPLSPDGYDPDEVDAWLWALKERLSACDDARSEEEIAEFAHNASFSTATVGYDRAEVASFLAALRADLATAVSPGLVAAPDPAPSGLDDGTGVASREHVPADVGPEAEAASPEPKDDSKIGAPIAGGGGSHKRSRGSRRSQVARGRVEKTQSVCPDGESARCDVTNEAESVVRVLVSPDMASLAEAIERAKRTMAGLEGFIDNEVAAVKAACERQVQTTQEECDRAFAEAAEKAERSLEAADSRLARERAAFERESVKNRRAFERQMEADRKSFDRELAALRAAAEQEAEDLRTAARREHAEARDVVEKAIAMQSSIAESLLQARAQLVPPHRQGELAA